MDGMNEQTNQPPPGTPGETPEGSTEGTPGKPEMQTGFWDWIRGLGLRRSDSERWIAGVAGGIAERTKLDPLIWRGVFVVLTLFGGPGILLYAIAWLLLPSAHGRIHLEDVFRGRAPGWIVGVTVGLGVLFLIGVVTGFNPIMFAWEPWVPGLEWVPITLNVLWWVGITIGVVWFCVWFFTRNESGNRGKTSARAWPQSGTSAGEPAGDPSASDDGRSYTEQANAFAQRVSDGATEFGERASRSATEFGERVSESVANAEERYAHTALDAGHKIITFALALLAGGLTSAYAFGGANFDARDSILLGGTVAVAVLGVSAIIAGVRGRRSGWVGFLSFVGVVSLALSLIAPANLEVRLAASETTRVDHIAEGEDRGIFVAAGSPNIDLRDLDHRNAEVGGTFSTVVLAGNIDVLLPSNVPVRVESRILGGRSTVVTDRSDTERDGERDSGREQRNGIVLVSSTLHNPEHRDDAPITTVSLWLLAGNITVTEEETR